MRLRCRRIPFSWHLFATYHDKNLEQTSQNLLPQHDFQFNCTSKINIFCASLGININFTAVVQHAFCLGGSIGTESVDFYRDVSKLGESSLLSSKMRKERRQEQEARIKQGVQYYNEIGSSRTMMKQHSACWNLKLIKPLLFFIFILKCVRMNCCKLNKLW